MYVGSVDDRWIHRQFVLQRIPKLQQHDQAVWWDTLSKMQKLLRKAALSLANSGKMDKDTMHNYFMSGESPAARLWQATSFLTVVKNAWSCCSNGARGDQRSVERKEHQEPLLGLRSLHQQHQPAESEEGVTLRRHPEQELGHRGVQAASGPEGRAVAGQDRKHEPTEVGGGKWGAPPPSATGSLD